MTQNTTGKYYVSVTGIVPTNFFALPKVGFYTFTSILAARRTEGNISASTTSYKGLQMTISVWESREKMLIFFRGSEHSAAMKQKKSISTYSKFHGYYTDELPTEAIAIQALIEDGRLGHGNPNSIYGDKVEEENN